MNCEPQDAHVRRDTPESFFGRRDIFEVWHTNWAPFRPLVFFARQDGKMPFLTEKKIYNFMRNWSSPTNKYQWCSPLSDLYRTDEGRALAKFLKQNKTWDTVRVEHCSLYNPQWHSFLHECHANRLLAFSDTTMTVGEVLLGDEYEKYFNSLSGNFRRELRRRLRQLEERHGRVATRVMDGRNDLEMHLRRGFALEAAGWKGRRQNAVVQHAQAFEYFYHLAKVAARTGSLRLIFLFCGESLIAFQYHLVHGKASFLLKTAYHEGYRRYAAGQLGTWHAMTRLHAEGIRHFNFFGNYVCWQEPWKPHLTPYGRIIVARRSLRGLCGAAPWWGKRAFKRIRVRLYSRK